MAKIMKNRDFSCFGCPRSTPPEGGVLLYQRLFKPFDRQKRMADGALLVLFWFSDPSTRVPKTQGFGGVQKSDFFMIFRFFPKN